MLLKKIIKIALDTLIGLLTLMTVSLFIFGILIMIFSILLNTGILK